MFHPKQKLTAIAISFPILLIHFAKDSRRFFLFNNKYSKAPVPKNTPIRMRRKPKAWLKVTASFRKIADPTIANKVFKFMKIALSAGPTLVMEKLYVICPKAVARTALNKR